MNKAIEKTIIVLFYAATLIACFLMLDIRTVSSALLNLNFIVVLILLIEVVFSTKRVKAKKFVALGLTIVFSFLGMILHSHTLSIGYMRKWIMFVCCIILFYVISEIKISSKMLKHYYICGVMLSAMYIYMYISGNHYVYALAITFNLGNPNFTGLCISCAILCLTSCFVYKKTRNIILWIIRLALLAFLVYLIIMTRARSSLFALAFFLLLCLYRGRIHKTTIMVILLVPLFFAVIYLQVIHNEFIMSFFDFLLAEGKELTSRVSIWTNAFDLIKEYPLLGNYDIVTESSGIGHMHNANIDIMASFGIPVFICLTLFLYFVLSEIVDGINNRAQRISLYGFYALMFFSIFEAALFVGSQGMYVLAGGLLMSAKYHRDVKDERIEAHGAQ